MKSPIIEEAKSIIDAAPNYGPLRPVEYANALPPRAAALAHVLADRRIVDAAKGYHEADASAVEAQGRFMRLGRSAAYFGFGAAVLGGALLYVGSDPSTETLRSNLGLVQSILLGISLVSAFALFLLKPYRKWRTQRGDAEARRLQVFALMMSDRRTAAEGEAPLLPLQLECFRRHLLRDQQQFFARRGPQQRRTVRVWKLLGAVALLLVLGSILPQLVRLETLGLFPRAVADFISRIPLDEKGYALVGLFGGALQALLAAFTVMSPAQRNADAYKEMRQRLDAYTAEKLDAVRAAAADGKEEIVSEFAAQVADDLAAEGREWLMLQEVLSELAPKRLVQQHKMSP